MLQQLKNKEVLVLGIVMGLILAATGMFWWSSQNKSLTALSPPSSSLGGTSTVISTQRSEQVVETTYSIPSEKKIIVYIVGAVQKPGVYELSEGARLAAAVQLAGGFSADADREAANLAMVVSDGARYQLPRIGEATAVMSDSVTGNGSAQSSSKTNINTADQTALEKLPQIGPARARAIIDYRTRNGPFKAIEDIKKVSGIGDSIFNQLRDLIIV